jgi:hypothetical protein
VDFNESTTNAKSPEIIMSGGKPTAVILGI